MGVLGVAFIGLGEGTAIGMLGGEGGEVSRCCSGETTTDASSV